MRMMALGLTAALAFGIPAPAAAQSFAPQTISPEFSVRPIVARPGGRFDNGFRDDRRRRGARSVGAVFVGNGWYGDNWALNNNRSWESDSYNDWWHDNPSRAYPRWMQGNQDCQRVWWSGGGWRC